MTTKPRFHEITDEEWESLIEEGKDWGDVIKMFNQPSWCNYPEALGGGWGCWSLTGRKITCKEDCNTCDCIITEEEK